MIGDIFISIGNLAKSRQFLSHYAQNNQFDPRALMIRTGTFFSKFTLHDFMIHIVQKPSIILGYIHSCVKFSVHAFCSIPSIVLDLISVCIFESER